VSRALDPIEKKPLFHFLPGTNTFSLATVGCNFHCQFCQNYSISQMDEAEPGFTADEVPPEVVVAAARHQKAASISYTYTEPTIFYEYARDIGVLARKNNLVNIFVSNGFYSRKCVEDMVSFVDAVNIDLKAFNEKTYRQIIGGRLQPVLDNIKYLAGTKIWIEITTLLVPGMNDSPEEIRSIAEFIASVNPKIPWHVSAFHPDYKMTGLPRTPARSVTEACGIGQEAGLKFIYAGNIRDGNGECTYCDSCQALVIKRRGFQVLENHLRGNKCQNCLRPLAGRFKV
jgi:pyruvate formate lyase activating enzyme